MFRRRRPKVPTFSRQVSGQLTTTFPTDLNPLVVGDAVILTYEDLLNSASVAAGAHNFANLVKGIRVVGWSWQSDYIAVLGTGGATQICFGAEAFYVDRTIEDAAGTGISAVAAGDGFLSVDQTSTEWDPKGFPERILHRRRFTVGATIVGGFVNAAVQTPGFGTERHIRRPFTLKPNQGFFWHQELYNVIGVEGGNSIQGDILGVISFQVLT